MDIIIGDRRQGKTYTLINDYFLKDPDTYLCVSCEGRKIQIIKEYKIKHNDQHRIFTLENQYCLLGKLEMKILIDDADMLLASLFKRICVCLKAVSITGNIKEINNPFINKDENDKQITKNQNDYFLKIR